MAAQELKCLQERAEDSGSQQSNSCDMSFAGRGVKRGRVFCSWTEQECLLLVTAKITERLQATEVGNSTEHCEQSCEARNDDIFVNNSIKGSENVILSVIEKWRRLVKSLAGEGVVKSEAQCCKKWRNLLLNYRRIQLYMQEQPHSECWNFDSVQQSAVKIVGFFNEAVFKALGRFLEHPSTGDLEALISEARQELQEVNTLLGVMPRKEGRKRKWREEDGEGAFHQQIMMQFLEFKLQQQQQSEVEMAAISAASTRMACEMVLQVFQMLLLLVKAWKD